MIFYIKQVKYSWMIICYFVHEFMVKCQIKLVIKKVVTHFQNHFCYKTVSMKELGELFWQQQKKKKAAEQK